MGGRIPSNMRPLVCFACARRGNFVPWALVSEARNPAAFCPANLDLYNYSKRNEIKHIFIDEEQGSTHIQGVQN